MENARLLTAILSILLSCSFPLCAANTPQGRYLDELVLRDVGDGRQFELVNEYRYADSRNTLWTVPSGAVVNGSSIPSYLWGPILGGPWEGLHRNASVIHDYFFHRKEYDSDSVHWVFYDAMIASGVNPLKAKVMYFAVLRFNPRWQASEFFKTPCPPEPSGFTAYNCEPVLADEVGWSVRYALVTPKFDAAELRETQSLIEKGDPSIEEIERLAKARREISDSNTQP